MNSRLKRRMTAVATAVVFATVGATMAPAAVAATGTPGGSAVPDAPPEVLAKLAAEPETKAALRPGAGAYRDAGTNRFIAYLDAQWGNPVRVEVRRVGSDEVVAVVDEFEYVDGGTGESGVPDDPSWYYGAKPFVLDAMADYEMDIYTKDHTGKEQSSRSAGRFTYALDARFEAQSGQQEFSLDDLDTTVTGSVTAVDPTTGERKPLAGARVRARLGAGTADVISDAQGKFTTSVAARGTEDSLSFSVSLTEGNTELAATAPARIRAQKAALTMTTTAPLTVRYSTAVALRGKLTRQADDGTIKPAAGRGVKAVGTPAGYLDTTAVVGADGSYALSPRIVSAGSWAVSVNDAWLTGDGTRTATVAKVTHTTKIVEEKLVATDVYGRMTISGKVVVDGYTTQKAPLEVEFQSGGRWISRSDLVVPYNETFTVTVNPVSGYAVTGWRLRSRGTSNIGPSTGTKVLRHSRVVETRTDEMKFGPRAVKKGEQLYVTGVLRTSSAEGYVRYPGQKVRYYFRPDGSTLWKEMGTSVSLSNGAVGKKFTAQTSGTWRIRFIDPDATHLANNSAEGRIEVSG